MDPKLIILFFIWQIRSWSRHFCLCESQVESFINMNSKLILSFFYKKGSQVDPIIFICVDSNLISLFIWFSSWYFYFSFNKTSQVNHFIYMDMKLFISFFIQQITSWFYHFYLSRSQIDYFLLLSCGVILIEHTGEGEREGQEEIKKKK